uniref:Uncharacterized protein n=1 Tax=Timspurckia oligopyrenoides TaxID=708627 RepID=A0A7S0ZHZ6_9RHOD|mmetsp:Transcript_6086/g.10806  ORF Transcript_6086/g.10806 Transcript_6086/m.10806 type:complete len:172 (+) Transcript_6086:82-597(+)
MESVSRKCGMIGFVGVHVISDGGRVLGLNGSVCGVQSSRTLDVVSRSKRVGSVLRCEKSKGTSEESSEEEVSVPLGKMDAEEMGVREQVLSALEEERAKVAKIKEVRSRINLGVTRDEDGKSNMWAVEPPLSMDDENAPNYIAIALGVFILAILAAAVAPNLAFFNNPDQF